MPAYNIEQITAGSSFSLVFRAQTSAGTPINLSGYSINSSIKEKYSSSTGIASFTSNITVPESGLCNVSLSAAQTSGLAAGVYVYQIYSNNTGTLDNISLLDGYLPIGPFPAF